MHLCFTFSIFSLLLPHDIYVNYKLALVKSICQRLNYNREEGSGNPLQYSCLEKSLDRAAWQAAVHGVAQSQTRLKRLSMPACMGERNGNQLQYSCLENHSDRGAWSVAIYGVAQSQTRLKQLSSSSRTTMGNLPAASVETEHCAAEVDCLHRPLREVRVENKAR